jgi:GT2 family glycosyltransferase
MARERRRRDRVLVLTPVKDAVRHLDGYFAALARLSYPSRLISLGLLESDSADGTYATLAARLPDLRARYRRARLWKRDFGFHIPSPYSRWTPAFQIPRRTILAKSRNHLLSRALADEDWVLWLDVDVADYPPDVLERLLATGKDILQPHCVVTPGGRTFDHNAWREQGRIHMEDLRGGPDLVRLDAVGGTMLLVKADVHREGLIFPPFLYGNRSAIVRDPNPWSRGTVGELETEGLGIMARDMGYQCWGLPNLEIIHRND